jgi:hypothetical protein
VSLSQTTCKCDLTGATVPISSAFYNALIGTLWSKLHDIFDPNMEDPRVESLVQAFSTSLRPEIDAAWMVAGSMGDDLLPLLAEAFSRIRKSEGRASVMRYVGSSRESEVAFRMGAVAVQDRAYEVRHYGCALLAYSLANVVVLRSPGSGLEESVIETLKKWKCEPAKDRDGKPVPTIVPFQINFHL